MSEFLSLQKLNTFVVYNVTFYWSMDPSNFGLLFQIVLEILVPLPFHKNFKISLLVTTEKLLGGLLRFYIPVYQIRENWYLNNIESFS